MQFLSTVCVAAISAALFRILVPENKFKKQISLLIAGILLLTGISSAAGAEFHIPEIEEGGYVTFSGEINKSLEKKICKDMSDKIYELLNSNGIFPEEIHIVVNISGLYSISITQVRLVFKAGETVAAEAAAELLSRELTDDIEIITAFKEEV